MPEYIFLRVTFRLFLEEEETNNMVICKPGFYAAVCVELELEGIAVNALLQVGAILLIHTPNDAYM